MKDTIIDVLTNEVIKVEISEVEQVRREADAVKTREEENKPKPPSIEDQLAQAKAENEKMSQQLAQVNGDFAAFTDFYFSKFPEQA